MCRAAHELVRAPSAVLDVYGMKTGAPHRGSLVRAAVYPVALVPPGRQSSAVHRLD